MVYEVTVDYVTSTTVLVDAEDTLSAEQAVYDYLRTDEGLDSVFQAIQENPVKDPCSFEVADIAAAPQFEPEDAEIREA